MPGIEAEQLLNEAYDILTNDCQDPRAWPRWKDIIDAALVLAQERNIPFNPSHPFVVIRASMLASQRKLTN